MTRHKQLFLLGAMTAAMLWPADLLAQRAVPRPPGRPVVAHPIYRPYYYAPFYPWYGYSGFYSPFYYNPYYFSFGFGYGYPYYGAFGYPYPYYYGRPDTTGAARLEVSPRNTKVYVDGYFAGTVDDFDGTFQRLNVEAGEHELQLYLDGYRPFSQKVLFVRGRTLKLIHPMEPLAPGESAGEPPKPDESRRQQQPSQPGYRGEPGQPAYRGEPGIRVHPPTGEGERSTFGSLLLRVRPSDATILVDGQVWTAPENEEQFVIELSEGPHRIEVRKDGFQTYATTVRVRRGETVRLNVGLTSGGQSSSGV